MRVEVALYAMLVDYLPEADRGRERTLEVPPGTTIAQVLARLGVPREKVKLIFLNGIHAEEDTLLKDGDRVAAFPPIAGG